MPQAAKAPEATKALGTAGSATRSDAITRLAKLAAYDAIKVVSRIVAKDEYLAERRRYGDPPSKPRLRLYGD